MRPATDQILLLSAQRLLTQVAPHVATIPYALGDVGSIAFVLMFAGQDVDRAADNLAADIRELQDIFTTAVPHVAAREPALAQALSASAEDQIVSLRVSALTERKAQCDALLIRLHALCEEEEADWARALEARILAHLRDSTQRRALVIPAPGG